VLVFVDVDMIGAVFPVRKFCTEQMFVLLRTKRMQLRNHPDTQTAKHSQRKKGYAIHTTNIYIYRPKFRILEVRKNAIALCKLPGGTAQLRILQGTLDKSMFMHFCLYLDDIIQALDANAKSNFFDSCFYWKPGYNTGLKRV